MLCSDCGQQQMVKAEFRLVVRPHTARQTHPYARTLFYYEPHPPPKRPKIDTLNREVCARCGQGADIRLTSVDICGCASGRDCRQEALETLLETSKFTLLQVFQQVRWARHALVLASMLRGPLARSSFS